MAAGILAPFPESVGESKDAPERVSVGANMGEEDGMFGLSKTIDNLLGQRLVHQVILEKGRG